jgi:uncharacterized protein with FMN-binding domain
MEQRLSRRRRNTELKHKRKYKEKTGRSKAEMKDGRYITATADFKKDNWIR